MQGANIPAEISDEMVLLESGLDSLGLAIIVARLEQELGYDPFVLMDSPVYPVTFKDFLEVYVSFQEYAK